MFMSGYIYIGLRLYHDKTAIFVNIGVYSSLFDSVRSFSLFFFDFIKFLEFHKISSDFITFDGFYYKNLNVFIWDVSSISEILHSHCYFIQDQWNSITLMGFYWLSWYKDFSWSSIWDITSLLWFIWLHCFIFLERIGDNT